MPVLQLLGEACLNIMDPPPFGHIFHGQNKCLSEIRCYQTACIQQNHTPPDIGEIMFDLIIVKNRSLWNDILQKCPQSGDIPLAISELINQAALRLDSRHAKGLVKSPVGI